MVILSLQFVVCVTLNVFWYKQAILLGKNEGLKHISFSCKPTSNKHIILIHFKWLTEDCIKFESHSYPYSNSGRLDSGRLSRYRHLWKLENLILTMIVRFLFKAVILLVAFILKNTIKMRLYLLKCQYIIEQISNYNISCKT